MDLVAGGDGSTITVTGTPGSTISIIAWRPGGGGYGGGSGGGGGGGTTGTYDDTDCAVTALHSKVEAKSDANTNEHWAIVYHDSTGYHASPIFTGTDGGDMSSLVNWMNYSGITF
jgi:hypothetical protein